MDARLLLVLVQLVGHLLHRLERAGVGGPENAKVSEGYPGDLHKDADGVFVDVFHRLFRGHDVAALGLAQIVVVYSPPETPGQAYTRRQSSGQTFPARLAPRLP